MTDAEFKKQVFKAVRQYGKGKLAEELKALIAETKAAEAPVEEPAVEGEIPVTDEAPIEEAPVSEEPNFEDPELLSSLLEG